MEIKEENNRIYFNYDDKSYANISIEDNKICLELIKTSPKFRHCGFAKRLLAEILKYIKLRFKSFRIYLDPLPLDTNGLNINQLISFYNKFGFKESKQRDIHHPYLMVKFL